MLGFTAFLAFTVGIWALPSLSLLEILVTMLGVQLSSDLYSGVMHIVLDHTDTIKYRLPSMWIPALEFQWHHEIPKDITWKPFANVCGDLNRAFGANIISYLVSYYYLGPN